MMFLKFGCLVSCRTRSLRRFVFQFAEVTIVFWNSHLKKERSLPTAKRKTVSTLKLFQRLTDGSQKSRRDRSAVPAVLPTYRDLGQPVAVEIIGAAAPKPVGKPIHSATAISTNDPGGPRVA
jgi:hypothetical protein